MLLYFLFGGRNGRVTGELISVIAGLKARLIHHRGERLGGIQQSALIHSEAQITVELDRMATAEQPRCHKAEGTAQLTQSSRGSSLPLAGMGDAEGQTAVVIEVVTGIDP